MGGTLLVVGLGNPGPEYEATRHNVGFMIVDRFAQMVRINVEENFSQSLIGRGRYAGTNVVVMKPLTFMNLSGGPVAKFIGTEKLRSEDMVVVHDEMDLEPGRIKMQKGRGAGGHNGVANIIERLGGQEFARLRMGIGRAGGYRGFTDHVLAPFEPEEMDVMRPAIERAAEVLKVMAARGLAMAMNEANRKEPAKDDAGGS